MPDDTIPHARQDIDRASVTSGHWWLTDAPSFRRQQPISPCSLGPIKATRLRTSSIRAQIVGVDPLIT